MVLREVLKWICRKRYINVAEISRELGVSKGLVEHHVQELNDKRLLKVVTPLGEEASCSFCPFRFSCQIRTTGVVKSYMLTEKGKQLLAISEQR